MQEGKVEGIVLRCQEYKERQRIITLFSPQGVLSLIVKGISSKKIPLLALTTPFSHAEYHFIKKRSELLFFQDGTLIHEHLELRQSLQRLRTAGALAQMILRSQWPGKDSPSLFALYKAYHQQVVRIENWQALLVSFYLKMLKMEGVLTFSNGMEQAGASVILFSDEEKRLLEEVGNLHHFSSLEARQVRTELVEKMEQFCEYLL